MIYKPFGGALTRPMRRETGLLVAEIAPNAARASRRKFDATGHYARPDVLSLKVNRTVQSPVTFR